MASGGVSNFWTPEKESLVSKLAAEKMSASAIAREIGAPTKNYVAGYCSRHKIQLQGRPLGPHIDDGKSIKKFSKPKPVFDKPKPVFDKPPIEDMFKAPETGVVSFADMDARMCKWPFGDDGYCGKETPERKESYCRFHSFLATDRTPRNVGHIQQGSRR